MSGSESGLRSSLVAAEAKAQTCAHAHTGFIRPVRVSTRRQETNRNRSDVDLGDVSASHRERRRRILLARFLDVVHVQSDRKQKDGSSAGGGQVTCLRGSEAAHM